MAVFVGKSLCELLWQLRVTSLRQHAGLLRGNHRHSRRDVSSHPANKEKQLKKPAIEEATGSF